MSDKVISLDARRGEVLGKVGGPVDESGVSLCVYGENLDPADITERLGAEPTAAHRKGDRKGVHSPPFERGGWFLTLRGEPPKNPESLTSEVLSRVTADADVWKQLCAEFDVQIRFGIHLEAWNRGFNLSAALISRVEATGADLVFDIYAYPDEGE